MRSSDFKDRNVVVLGFGVEGQSTVEWLLNHGSIVQVSDDRPRQAFDENLIAPLESRGVKFAFATIPTLGGIDIVIRTPGAKLDHVLLQQAKSAGIAVTSATNIFLENCLGTVIGVTGTKGKGTTAALIHEMLLAAGETTYLGGNIGYPMLSFLSEIRPNDIAVLELSSFQLMDATRSPHVAVVLMTTSEHLDYHANVDEYISAKTGITKHQKSGDFVVVNRDYESSLHIASHSPARVLSVSAKQSIPGDGCYADDRTVRLVWDKQVTEVIPIKEIFLPGRHNRENVCAAVAAASLFSVPVETMRNVLKNFLGLPHRLELVGEFNSVTYYNDSFATIPESTIAAVQSFDRPLILILGGSSKGSDFSQLGAVLRSRPNLKAVIGIGQEWPRIKAALNLAPGVQVIEDLSTMSDIVETARKISQPGDCILLSPACASFGMFRDYKDRGDQFRNAVRTIASA